MEERSLASRVTRHLGSDIATYVHQHTQSCGDDIELKSDLRRTSLRLAAAFARANESSNPDRQLDALDEARGLVDEMEALSVVALRLGTAAVPAIEELMRRLGHLRQSIERRMEFNLADLPGIDDEQ